MRSLVILIFFTTQSWSMPCRDYEGVADYLNTENFKKRSREYRDKHGKEPVLKVGDVNQARMLAFRFPAFVDLGFGMPGDRTKGWVPYMGRLAQSPLVGKKVGYEIRNSFGHARVRFDWSPEHGAHFNLEITQKTPTGTKSHKVAVAFNCNGAKCTEQEFKKLGESMFRENER